MLELNGWEEIGRAERALGLLHAYNAWKTRHWKCLFLSAAMRARVGIDGASGATVNLPNIARGYEANKECK